MGFFGRFSYSKGQWTEGEPSGAPSLTVDIHDSDIATVDYTPSGSASGRFYLGTEPRVYFEDPKANGPVDRVAEAQGFAVWVRQVTGRDLSPETVAGYMATADADVEPLDVFVEETVERLLTLTGLPLPGGLTGDGEAQQAAQPEKRRGWFRRR